MTSCDHGHTVGQPRGDQWAVACAKCGAILQVFPRRLSIDSVLERVLPKLPLTDQIELQAAVLELRQAAREGDRHVRVDLPPHGSDALPEGGK